LKFPRLTPTPHPKIQKTPVENSLLSRVAMDNKMAVDIFRIGCKASVHRGQLLQWEIHRIIQLNNATPGENDGRGKLNPAWT
jgi:hypothetical protein